MTYPASDSRATNAAYTVTRTVKSRNGVELVTDLPDPVQNRSGQIVNQRISPRDGRFASAQWHRFDAVYHVDIKNILPGQLGALTVSLGNNADGIVAADAIRLVRVSPARHPLKALDVRGNPLNNESIDMAREFDSIIDIYSAPDRERCATM